MAQPPTDPEIVLKPAVTPGGSGDPRPPIRSYGLTDRGKVRRVNEDQFLISDLSTMLRVRSSSVLPHGHREGRIQGHCFVVADGIGGGPAGEKASAMLVDGVECFLSDSLLRLLGTSERATEALAAGLEKALSDIDAMLFAEAAEHPELHGMGTTVTLALTLNSELLITHVGDSRCYLFRDGKLQQLTHDHTIAQTLIDGGLPSLTQLEHSSLRSMITNAVGGNTPGVTPDVFRMHVEPGDALLLCTDGLPRMVTDDEIAAMLAEKLDPRSVCQRLVDSANAQGGRDNVTVVVAKFEAPGE